jgi:Tol biopolymer transport system component
MRRLLGLLAAGAAAAAFPALGPDHALANHVQCGDVITQDTTLDSDLTDCPGNGLVIGASNVTVDLNGHVIEGVSGDHGTGIANEPDSGSQGYDDVTVENGTIRQFDIGIDVYRSDGQLVRNVALLSNEYAGVRLSDTQNARVVDNKLRENDMGIVSGDFPGGAIVERNHVLSNRHNGIVFYDYGVGHVTRRGVAYANSARIAHNVVAGNGDAGIYDESSSAIDHNTITRNGAGIVANHGSITLSRNTIQGNEGVGISTGWPSAPHIIANLISGNGSDGISVGYCAHVENNVITGSRGNGIVAKDGTCSPIEGNSVSRNRLDGILVGGDLNGEFSPFTIAGNVATRNGDDGIDVDPIYGSYLSPLSWSPDGSRLAFASDRDGSRNVYTAKPDGSDLRRLTTAGGSDPTWSPDGSLIAFSADQGLYTIHPDGTGLRRIADLAYAVFAWSPDGAKLAFGRTTGMQGNDLVVVNADGSDPTRLTSGWAPVWSPDGSKIAFVDEVGVFPLASTQLFSINADGSNRLRLSGGGTPSWSPDGTKLVVYGGDDLYTVNADGTGLSNLTADNPYGFDRSPAWSPDGTKIAFESNPCDPDDTACGGPGIFTIEPDGSNRSRVTSIPGASVWFGSIAWSSDGSRIAFVNSTGDRSRGYTVNADGTGLLELKIEGNNDKVALRSNRADRNADLGIEAAEGVIDRGANRAKHNGNPAQCVPGSLCGTVGSRSRTQPYSTPATRRASSGSS